LQLWDRAGMLLVGLCFLRRPQSGKQAVPTPEHGHEGRGTLGTRVFWDEGGGWSREREL
jgi:hypothetical protein